MEIQHRLDLMRLLSAQCDGQLEDADQTRLEELLSGDAEARLVYLHYVDMHARLLVHPGMVEARSTPLEVGRAETSSEPVLSRLAVTRTKPVEPMQPRRRHRVRQILPYLGVMVATVAATLLIQFAIARWQPSSDRSRQVVEQEPPIPPMYVATQLTQSADAQWDGGGEGHQPGSRLPPGELRLKKGVVRIRFDSGADLLVVGPTTLRLESIAEASLMLGKVTFRADEAAVPFTLSTPTSLLVESGTACGVEVKEGRDEVHVFEGEIQRFARDGNDETPPQVLAAGQARKYSSSAVGAGEATALDQTRFVRNLPEAARQPGDLVAGLLAYEPFDYQDAEALKNKAAEGGVGWAGPWEPGMVWGLPGRGGFDRGPKPNVLNVEAGLGRTDAVAASSGGMMETTSFVNYQRRLATPVHLDADGVYYLSLLLRRERYNDRGSSLSVTLRQATDPTREQNQGPENRKDDHGWDRHFGWDWHRGRGGRPEFPKQVMFGLSGTKLYTDFGELFRNDRRDSLPLSDGQTYLFVAKIAASATNSNQIFLRVYGPDDAVDADEPGDWSVVGKQFQANYVLDRLELGINGSSNNREAVDELRLGTTWSSVTAPWVSSTPSNPSAEQSPAADSKAETK